MIRSPRRVAASAVRDRRSLTVAALAVVAVAVLLLVGLRALPGLLGSGATSGPGEAGPAPAATARIPQVGERPTAELCHDIAAGFATVLFDKTTPDAQWARMMGSWVTDDVAASLPDLPRDAILPNRATRVVPSLFPHSCDVRVDLDNAAPMRVVVVRTPAGWRVSEWGSA